MEEKKTKRRGTGYFMKRLADKGVRHQKEKEDRHGGFDSDSFHRSILCRFPINPSSYRTPPRDSDNGTESF